MMLADLPASLVCGGLSSQGISRASYFTAMSATISSIVPCSVIRPAYTGSNRRSSPESIR